MPSAVLKRVEKYLEVARTNRNAELTDALQDIVDAIRILDAKLMTVQRQERPATVSSHHPGANPST